MATESTIKVKITADASDAEKAVDDLKQDVEDVGTKSGSTGTGAFSNIGSAAKSVASTVGKTLTAAVTALGTAVGTVATKAISAYADYEQFVGGVETLFGESASVVEEYAANAYRTAGISANEYMEQATSFSASLIQSLDGDTAAAAEYANLAITDMADNANKMGTSMEDIENAYQGFAKQNYTMLDNLKLGYGGTEEEMQRLIDDANEIAIAQGEAGDLTIDSYADIVEAIHLVQDEMGITGTTAEEAATTISGSISSMEAAWENWLTGLADENADMGELTDELLASVETVAENLAPVIAQVGESMVSELGDVLTGAVDALAPALSEAVAGLWNAVIVEAASWVGIELPQADASALEEGLSGVIDFVQGIWDGLSPIVEGIVDTISSIFSGIAPLVSQLVSTVASSGIGAAFQSIGTAIGAAFSSIGTVIESILNLCTQLGVGQVIGTAFSVVFQTISAVVQVASGVIQGIAGVVTAVVTTITTVITALQTSWTTVWTAIRAVISTVWNGIKSVVTSVLSVVASTISGKLSSIKSTWTSVWNSVKTFFSSIWSGIKSAASSGISGVVTTVSGIRSKITNVFSNCGQWLVSAGKNILNGLANGIKSAIEGVLSVVTNAATSVINKVCTLLGIASPSKVMMEIGGYTMEGLAEGIEAGADEALAAAGSVAASLPSAFGSIGADIQLGMGYDVSGLQTVSADAGSASGTVINQSFATKVVRSDSDLYTAAPIIYRSAMREASL